MVNNSNFRIHNWITFEKILKFFIFLSNMVQRNTYNNWLKKYYTNNTEKNVNDMILRHILFSFKLSSNK